MIPSLFEIIDKSKELWEYLQSKHRRLRKEKEISIPFSTTMADILAEIHGYAPLERGGSRWPIAVWDKGITNYDDPDEFLGTLDRSYSSDVSLASKTYLKRLKSDLDRVLYNGNTFVLKKINLEENAPKLDCALGTYFDAVSTCDALETELLDAIRKFSPSTASEVLACCPRRSSFCKMCIDPAQSGAARSAAIGISCLIAYSDGRDYFGLLRARSPQVAAHPGKYHVIPAGMFGADTDAISKEYSLRHSFFREYQEELFENRELRLDRPSGQIAHDWFYEREQLKTLFELLDNQKAKLHLTGYSLNLTNYRPEVLLMLLIDDPKWMRQRLSTNFEYVNPQELRDSGKDTLLPLNLNASDDEVTELIKTFADTFVPPGIAALWAGKKFLRVGI